MSDQNPQDVVMTYLVITDDGQSSFRNLSRGDVVELRNQDPSVIRIRKMNHETINKCNCCREYFVLHDETPDCRLCRDMWALKSISGKSLGRPEDGPIRSNEMW